MSNYFCVNKSGKSVPVYSNPEKSSKIGTIYNRETFGYNRNWGGDNYFCFIIFRKSNGTLSSGFIIDPPNGTLSHCTDYPYGRATINGTSYITLIMRNSKNVYTAGGTKWGDVAANCRVACLDGVAGDSHPEWKKINDVESSKGGWVKVTGDGSSYGFVDAGLSTASGYSSIPMYDSW